jgi:hypothetical protein
MTSTESPSVSRSAAFSATYQTPGCVAESTSVTVVPLGVAGVPPFFDSFSVNVDISAAVSRSLTSSVFTAVKNTRRRAAVDSLSRNSGIR